MSTIHLIAGTEGAKRNVVLIHGLGGHYRKTWTAGKDKCQFWPEWLQQDDPDLRIWSVEYETSLLTRLQPDMGLKDRAQNIFKLLLLQNDITRGEVIFIGHSQGGLLIKQIIRLASDRKDEPKARELLNSISGVAFLGTPHQGSDASSIGNTLLARLLTFALTFGGQPSAMTAYLYRNNPDLRELNNWYRNWDRTFAGNHLVLGESRKSYRLVRIVPPDSSDPGIQAEMVMVDTDHNGICKPDSRQNEVYQHVLNFVKSSKITPQHLWLMKHFGSQVRGWRGYQNWSGAAQDVDGRYIIDDKVKFSDASIDTGRKITAEEMLNAMIQKLAVPGAVLRLVGLSGVGKTRFVQALFETGTGRAALSPDTVFYTDAGGQAFPAPDALLEKLKSTEQEAVVVVDNCALALHNSLNSVLNADPGPACSRLLTVEYDVRDDIPDNTDVISMEAGSGELIETLISGYFPDISQASRSTIAEFSGGNARVALALAATIGRGENISRLRSSELFSRLFDQRHSASPELMRAGSLLSLVYSFRFTAGDGYSDELTVMARLARLHHNDLYASAQEIQRRGLAQVRGDWMAILPHPVANGLAQRALEDIPHAQILSALDPDQHERLFRSFTRRLGYLSDSREAAAMADKMLTSDGLFDRMLARGKGRYTEIFSLIASVAPVAQEQTLDFITRTGDQMPDGWFFTCDNPAFTVIARLLRSLAYEARYFEQCVWLLCRFADNEKANENNASSTGLLYTLFYIHLSGTHAPLTMRLNIIDTLLLEQRTGLASRLLESLLKSSHFTSFQGFDFGAQVRDFGYLPQTMNDYETWFCRVLDFLIASCIRHSEFSREACRLVHSSFRSLWKIKPAQVQLVTLIEKLIGSPGDEVLWPTVKQAIHFDAEKQTEAEWEALQQLEQLTRPDSLAQKLNIFIFSQQRSFYGLGEKDEDGENHTSGYDVANKLAAALGRDVASCLPDLRDSIIYRALLEDSDYGRMMEFSTVLGKEISDPQDFCQKLNTQITLLGAENIKNVFLCGSLRGIYHQASALCHTVLDAWLHMPKMEKHFAIIQAHIPMDANSIERVMHHLEDPEKDVSGYRILASGRRHAIIPDSSLIELLQLMWRHHNGPSTAFDILSMRVHDDGRDGYICSEPLLELARGRICAIIYGHPVPTRDIPTYNISAIAKRAFQACSAEQARDLLAAIVRSSERYTLHDYDFTELLGHICYYQPQVILDRLCPAPGVVDEAFHDVVSQRSYSKDQPLTVLPMAVTMAWCQQDPRTRYPRLATLISPYEKSGEHLVWTALASALIAGAPSPEPVLSGLVHNAFVDDDLGSRAACAEDKLTLLAELRNSGSPELALAASRMMDEVQERFDSDQQRSARLNRRDSEQFEY
ncbi:esterase/lipase family protein [Erwinia billingiae]|uniref:esterase/lipase family protein n=1 Tax=Erwinia billingiae TaxID=182337 RepID=UPI000D0093EE|nr:hypothetical protein [Erwinia billingiae]PRB59656.1 hypothetical protein CQ001_12700 [Erwinia billingiae]